MIIFSDHCGYCPLGRKEEKMKIHYDPKVDALDIVFKKGKVAETREIGPEILLDVDKKGDPLSLEILGAKERYKPLDLKNIQFKSPVEA